MNAERMRKGLLVIAQNMRGAPYDMRPLSYDMCQQVAEFALALAHDQPWPEFDSSYRSDTEGEHSHSQPNGGGGAE